MTDDKGPVPGGATEEFTSVEDGGDTFNSQKAIARFKQNRVKQPAGFGLKFESDPRTGGFVARLRGSGPVQTSKPSLEEEGGEERNQLLQRINELRRVKEDKETQADFFRWFQDGTDSLPGIYSPQIEFLSSPSERPIRVRVIWQSVCGKGKEKRLQAGTFEELRDQLCHMTWEVEKKSKKERRRQVGGGRRLSLVGT